MSKKENALHKALRQNVQTNRDKILKQFNYECQACGLNTPEFLEIHHLLSLKKGGNNEIYNLAPLCPNCHKALHIWLDQKGGSDVINKSYSKNIPHEHYMNLANLLRRAMKLNNERVEKINQFYEMKNKERGL